MRYLICVLVCACAAAQTPPDSGNAPRWQQTFGSLPAQPNPNLNAQEIDRFANNVQEAAPYFATLTPGDYEANRELIRRMWTYLAGMEMMARSPQMRASVIRARQAMLGLRGGFLAGPQANMSAPAQQQAAPVQRPFEPSFSMQAPLIEQVPEADKNNAEELCTRYEMAAGRALAALQSAEVLRLSLAAEGNTLNTQTATSVGRLPGYFNLASERLRKRDWAGATTNLERAEYETDKIFKTVGR